MHAAINLRLAMTGLPMPSDAQDAPETQLLSPLLARQQELARRLEYRPCHPDLRIQTFLDDYLSDASIQPTLPKRTLVLDSPGLARELSLPADGDEFSSELFSSYRAQNGVLHNPFNDRRTTAGVFHVAEGGLPIPDDKLAVPKETFARILSKALEPLAQDMVLPYTSQSDDPPGCFVSLLLRPIVVPEVAGVSRERTMEIRFIVPGGMVANLDFVESVFGNGGDPNLPGNDAALDPGGWTGHTGCIILAPHLIQLTKRELGLPHIDEATDRQKRDGMCWSEADEKYNGGTAFKLCARDERGVIVTVIADNYFGYCKKEVKTQIGYSANLFGSAEEEHSGGARVFPSYDLGQEFTNEQDDDAFTLDDVLDRDPDRFTRRPEGHVLDTTFEEFVLVPAGAHFSLRQQTVSWKDAAGTTQTIKLRADRTYFSPSGYRVHIEPSFADTGQWILVGTTARSTTCHKPSTVSGGGKSEISKAITDAFIYGNAYTPDFDEDMKVVAELLDHDFSDRFMDSSREDTRPILSPQRSMGSVIKLFTPSDEDYTEEYSAWLRDELPQNIKELIFLIKRHYRPEWGEDWRSHFTVGNMNGRQGNFVRLDGSKLMVTMLRVGFEPDGSWRLFGLRPDFSPAVKVQTEDDITASIVMPGSVMHPAQAASRKFVKNCEALLFQRPDEAINRGYDTQAEKDIAGPGTFLSNYQPLTHDDAREMRDNAVAFSAFTEPMKNLISTAAAMTDDESPKYFVSSANPRLVNGKPSKNPRYLQVRPDIANPVATAASDLASHLLRKQPSTREILLPVDLIAAGRRNNPPEKGVPALCAYAPLHYMELPELFMEFISSMTGKSPSTTGAGSEGALTKGPFNAMPAIIDLNAAFLSYALTEYDGWLSSAGHIGPQVRIDHDFSLLVPEVFARMTEEERSAENLIAGGHLERLTDFEHNGSEVLASRLGYRMTERFAAGYFGRIFMHPHRVFTTEMLRPELQDMGVFADSMATIVATHQRVAQAYFNDGTIDLAIPPLKALLEIMATGVTAEGRDLDDPEFRAQFTRDRVLSSDWYAARLDAKRAENIRCAQEGVESLEAFCDVEANDVTVQRLGLHDRLERAREELAVFSSEAYRDSLVGMLGRQPL